MTLEEDGCRGRIYMHRSLSGEPEGVHVDHHDQDSLNNRRDNLRVASASQNGCNRPKQADNTTGFKGVKHDKRYGIWTAHIKINKKSKHLGTFKSPEEAARAYDAKALELFGEFARLNFPREAA